MRATRESRLTRSLHRSTNRRTMWWLLIGWWMVAAGCASGSDAPLAQDATLAQDAPRPVAVLMVDTGDTEVGDEKVPASLEIIEQHDGTLNDLDDAARSWSGQIGIELRGTTSRSFPKSSYSFETRDSAGEDVDAALLGFPPESDWVLYGPYSDKTFLRNVLAYELASRQGRYHPRTRFVELFVNNRYDGVYVMTERISRDSERVDIERTDTETAPADGGYIIRREAQPDAPQWRSAHPTDWYYHYPKDRNLTDDQRAYLHQQVDALERFLAGVQPDTPAGELEAFIDVEAWIDYVLVQELTRNADAFKKSFYLVKRSSDNGGQFAPGPVWDFNIAWGNLEFFGGAGTEGLLLESFDDEFTFPDSYPTWWRNLLANHDVVDAMRCRWETLRRDGWSDDAITAEIDRHVEILEPVRERDDERWNTIGVYVWPNPTVESSWGLEVDTFEKWVVERTAWLDAHLPGTCA